MKRSFLFIFLFLTTLHVFAQDDLFGPKAKTKARKGWILVANGSFDVPAADMAKSFGLSYRIGPGVLYKTSNNWVFGAKGDFILGGKIKVDSFMNNIKDKYGDFINSVGEREGVPIYERGYMIGLQAGKIINISKANADNGIMFLTAAGFMQHKIDIFIRDKNVPELAGQYLKGYDRLTNGPFIEEYIAYSYLAKDGLLNFHIGLDITAGFTQDRRDYLFDIMRADSGNKLDILYGIRGGWYIPIFKRKSEELIFE